MNAPSPVNSDSTASASIDVDVTALDLAPVAWVLEEIRKSMEVTAKAVRRYARDLELLHGSDPQGLDDAALQQARVQVHQAAGALEMVGQQVPARFAVAMDMAVETFILDPRKCTDEAAGRIERASFAIVEYLETLLSGRVAISVGLFPQFRECLEIVGAERVHPADLWERPWSWAQPAKLDAEPLQIVPAVRARMDQAALKLIKSGDVFAALSMAEITAGLAAGATVQKEGAFWTLASAYYECMANGLIPFDVYAKRASSRVLMQFGTIARGDHTLSERLAQDLLFFAAQANTPDTPDTKTPALDAVRRAWDLYSHSNVSYEQPMYGRFDPAMLVQARKRIDTAKETWSSLSGGEMTKLRVVGEQFGMVSESMVKLYPPSAPLGTALSNAVDSVVRNGLAPPPELAMEVATSILYLEAAFEELDVSDTNLEMRTHHLAQRLEHVRGGGQAEPLEAWMEDLYRRVSDRQTMGTVVGELRATLGEVEKSLDTFFRNPQDKKALATVPGALAQMRGVLSVLGLDHATQAVLRMRDTVEEILITELDEERARAAGTFDKLGNNLGALGFLIDMLSYQPALAKKLFTFDAQSGELKPLMGRTQQAVTHGAGRQTDNEIGEIGTGTIVQAVDEELDFPSLSSFGALPSGNMPPPDEDMFDPFSESAATPLQPPVDPLLAEGRRMAESSPPSPEEIADFRDSISISPEMEMQQETQEALAELAEVVSASKATPMEPVPATEPQEFDEDDLTGIFLEEAREVIQSGQEALDGLAVDAGDTAQMTTLRRAFHTLKGSSRMVGLNEFGEAAWSLEQLINTWLADERAASPELISLCSNALQGLTAWVNDIEKITDNEWRATGFRTAADALRLENRLVSFDGSGAATPAEDDVADFAHADFDDMSTDFAPVEIRDIDYGSLKDLAPVAPEEPESMLGLSTDFDVPLEDDEFAVEASPTEEIAELAATFRVNDAGSEEPKIEIEDEAPIIESTVVDVHEDESRTPASADSPVEAPVIESTVIDVPHSIESSNESNNESSSDSVGEVSDETSASEADDQVKVIGTLRIGIPLYNVYLNEADEWSRTLVTETAEWALESHRPLPDSIIALAHSLGGSSATVGFTALSDIARMLEKALLHVQLHGHGAVWNATVFAEAAEDIRRLLHQFAAGFLKEPPQAIMQALQQVLDSEPTQDAPPEIDSFEVDVHPAEADQPTQEYQAPAEPRDLIAPATFVPPVGQNEPSHSLDDEDEFSDVVDAVDVDLFPIFEEEASELMPQLAGTLRQWSARPENLSARGEVLRVLHTLKGSARLAGALRLGEMSHRMESEIEKLGSADLTSELVEPLMTRFDTMEESFDELKLAEARRLSGEDGAPAAAAVEPATAPTVPADSATTEITPIALATPTETKPPFARNAVALAAPLALSPLRASTNQAVRVRSQLLDRLMNQTGEVMITRSRMEAELGNLRGSLGDLTDNLDRLRQQLRDIELQAESQMQSRLAQAKDTQQGFDPLEFDRFTRVQELTRMMAESVNDVATVQRNLQRTVQATEDDLNAQARQTRELQRDLLRTRMVEFEGISERLYRVVRQASKDTGKQVKLDINGGSIEVDRGVLDRMTPAFEHLLRNCVAHGIEDAAKRVAAGKDAVGTIQVELGQEGNDVSVKFTDDGAGIDTARVRERAVALGLISPDHQLTDSEAAELIFAPGFSTVTQISELAGRGIGMDVVRSEVNALGGRIETTSALGKGASFKLVLPLTTAVTQVVMIRIGEQSIGVPANMVEIVRRSPAKEVQQAYNSGIYDFAGEQLPFYWAGALLQSSTRSFEDQGKSLTVIVFRSAARRIAVHVDEVLGNQEVVVKNLGPQLARLPGLAGMSILASGAVVLIYNPVALSTVYGDLARSFSADSAQPEVLEAAGNGASAPSAPARIPLVLVVDDSITVRRVTQRLLQREGYRVTLAADGLQALEKLQDERPVIVLSDIEMPRMDGFDLARNIRADAKLKDLPIVMITSRIANKHREHAEQLGVNHYLGKPYSEEELLALVRRYASDLSSDFLTTA